jgi:hypothetical protein
MLRFSKHDIQLNKKPIDVMGFLFAYFYRMRSFLLFILFFSGATCFAQQKKSLIQIHCNAPAFLKNGDKIELPVSITYQLKEEHTGTVSFELLNTETNTSVDGWFLNVFPLQYFASIKNKTFRTKFPITVPMDYKGKIKIMLKASCAEAKDSIALIIPIHSTKMLHD